MDALSQCIVVLDRPQDAVNIGAVVRAMKNMGVSQLRLVQPRPYTRDDLLRVAHRCDDIVDAIVVCVDLDQALADAIYVVGTAAIVHAGRSLVRDVRGLAGDLLPRMAQGPVALVFGTEDDGLDRRALDRCHVIAMIPTDPAYPALNLAQSVLLFLYDVRMAALGALPAPPPTREPAAQAALEQLFTLSHQALVTTGFLNYNPNGPLSSLRQIAYRARLSQADVALLTAIVRRIIATQKERQEPES